MQHKFFNHCISCVLTATMFLTSSGMISFASEKKHEIQGISSGTKGFYYTSSITEDLSDKMKKTDGFIDSMIYFKDEASISKAKKLSEKINTEEPKDDKDRKAVIAELYQTAMESQDGILNWLEGEKKLGNVKKFESFYIVNSIHLIAKKEVIERLSSDPKIEKIDINKSIKHDDIIPDVKKQDTSVDEDIEWNIKKIGADLAWKQGITGKGVTIGIMDSAVDVQHPALKRKFKGYDKATGKVNFNSENYFDALEDMGDTSRVSDMEHGSHCTGIMVGSEESSNGEKYNQIGVAPDAQWISARIFDDSIRNTSSANYIRAAEWMMAPGGNPANAPQIINNSWGGSQYNADTWFRDTVKSLREAHILPVFASGNQMPGEALPGPGSIVTPASYLESFAVGAVDRNSNLAYFSKRGPSLFKDVIDVKPEISAPGVHVRSTVRGSYAYMSGTSMAAPHVSGVAALVKSAKSSLDDKDIQKILQDTATPAIDSEYKTSPNNGYGYGVVNAYAAVNRALDKEVGTISGKILSEGKPVGAEISVEGTDISVRSNAGTGEFYLKYPSEKKITLVCRAYGYNTKKEEVALNKDKSTKVDFELEKKERKDLSGIVRDSEGSAVKDASVYLVEDDNTNIEITNLNGKYSIKDIPVGEYTLRVFKRGYKFYEKKINITSDSSIIDVNLENKNGNLNQELYYDNGKENQGLEKRNQIVGSTGEKAVAVRFNPAKKGILNSVKIRFLSSNEHSAGSVRISVVAFDKNNRMKTLLPSTKISSINPINDTIVNLEKYNIKIEQEFYVVVEPDEGRSFLLGLDSTAKNNMGHSYSVDGGYFKPFTNISNKKGSLMIRSILDYEEDAESIDNTESEKREELSNSKKRLLNRINEVKENLNRVKKSENGEDINKEKEWVKAEVWETLNNIVSEAYDIYNNSSISKPDVEKIIEKLNSSEQNFNKNKHFGNKVNNEEIKTLPIDPNKDKKEEPKKDKEQDNKIKDEEGNKKENENKKEKDKKDEKKEEKPETRFSRVTRIKGNDRIETAIEISKKYFSEANTVIVVTDKNYPDSLSASTLSKLLRAPILLTDSNKFLYNVKNEILRLGTKNIIIIGGRDSVSGNIEKELKNISSVERISGEDRYITSGKVADKVVSITGYSNRAVVVSGENYPDALTVSSMAAREDMPILLVKKDEIPSYIKKIISDLKINETYLIGGNNSISKILENDLFMKERISGYDRYDTALNVSKFAYPNTEKIFIATGEGFSDALVIGGVSAIQQAPIQLVNPSYTSSQIIDNIRNKNLKDIVVVGGEVSVPNSIVEKFAK